MQNLIHGRYRKTTSHLRERDRLDYWRDVICDEFVKLDCSRVGTGYFNGELHGGIDFGGLRLSEVIADPQFVERSRGQIAKSTEAEFLISFQLAQQGLVRQRGREALLQPGSFALYDSTQPYSLTFQRPFHQLVLQIPKETMTNHLINPEKHTAIAIPGNAGLGVVLVNFMILLAREYDNVMQAPDDLSDHLMHMITMTFNSSRQAMDNHPIVRELLKRRVLRYIDKNLHNSELCNGRIAQAQHISIRYLYKLFQDEAETIHALILRKRLERARQLLGDPTNAGCSIEQIAYRTGFTYSSHFSRAFKKHYGVSPRDFR